MAKNRSCRHCGSAETRVESSHLNSRVLREAVAAANMPKAISAEFATALSKRPDLISSAHRESAEPERLLRAAERLGAIEKENFFEIAAKYGLIQSEAEKILAEAELEGVLVRRGDGVWAFIEG